VQKFEIKDLKMHTNFTKFALFTIFPSLILFKFWVYCGLKFILAFWVTHKLKQLCHSFVGIKCSETSHSNEIIFSRACESSFNSGTL